MHHENPVARFFCYHCFPKKLVQGLEKLLFKDILVRNLTIDGEKTSPSKCRCIWCGRKKLPPRQIKVTRRSSYPSLWNLLIPDLKEDLLI